ncbi:hypothetical protein RclHR1_05790013 [Rhizophagus clarus]|uniref:Uncharacterized protein n=1 Tax=Rhizophagus clarus TaxID=94130 RepID=A0A2Z6S7E2_9GLOM|nr:hypothetical protein RclHR1_05790013 [Rhizophagus clarus]GES79510.1 hypothetical protein RCL_e21758_RclHR1_05790013 [Rhizophagus clarus]
MQVSRSIFSQFVYAEPVNNEYLTGNFMRNLLVPQESNKEEMFNRMVARMKAPEQMQDKFEEFFKIQTEIICEVQLEEVTNL